MLNLFNWFTKRMLLKNIAVVEKRGEKLKLNIGAGGTIFPSWISIEKKQLDITKSEDFIKFFKPSIINKLLAEHVIEHIELQEFENFLLNIRPFLDKFASIRIAVPDAMHPSSYVKCLTMPGGLEHGADDHKYFYSIYDMQRIANKTGYQLSPIEYFDDKGIFYCLEDNWERGYISRSARNYKGRFTEDIEEMKKLIESVPPNLQYQFIENKISYTSLIVDFLVP
jgi:predicted SAM-dependent methyltransferase